ncbi:hypothetical protein T484DRAFT_1900056 [Baffinella frigidus]|nr:hypothetical protein T484DRAFT_1900056 [Cryptophyta sp. CCMP2293]
MNGMARKTRDGADKVAAPQAMRISQETFDDAVKENMDDFSMERVEAIADAISQFEMQGIDISNIVTSTSNLNGGEDPLAAAVKRLVAASKVEDAEGASAACAEMDLIYKTLSEAEAVAEGKLMVGNAGAIEAALAVLDTHPRSSETVLTALKFITALTTKADVNKARLSEPKDDPRAPAILIKVLDALPSDAVVMEAAWRLIKSGVTKSECFKGGFMKEGGHRVILSALSTHLDSSPIMLEVSGAMYSLMNADDLTTVFSSVFETAKALVKGGVLPLMYAALRRHELDPKVLRELLAALKGSAVQDDIVREILSDVGLPLVLGVLKTHIEDTGVGLGGGAVRVLGNRRHGAAHAGQLRHHDGRGQDFCAPLREEGVEELVVRARDTHVKCADAAFDCLRDLGCEYGGLGDQAGKGANSAYTGGSESLLVSADEQARRGSGMVTWEEDA